MDALLNLDRRMGMSADELTEFERKASEVANLVAGLKDGRLKPEDVKVPGEKTEEEKRAEEQAAARRKAEEARKAAEKSAKECAEWWERAELLTGRSRTEAAAARQERAEALASGRSRQGASQSLTNNGESIVITNDDGAVLFPKPKTKADALDYSVWDKWVPDDPVSLEEMQRAKDKIEDDRNAEFERANPDFCRQFKDDQEKREQQREEKERRAERLREKGNKLFRRKKLDDALAAYFESLKLIPWSCATLGNIAQVYLKSEDYANAREFCDRALFLDSDNVKALWRRSRACTAVGDLVNAAEDLRFASLIDPANQDVERELKAIRAELTEAAAEKRIAECSDKSSLAAELRESASNQEPEHVAAALEQVMRDPAAHMSVNQRMCEAIGKGHANVKGLGVDQTLAVDGLAALLSPESEDESQAQIRVLLRSSGALETLMAWATNGLGGSPVQTLLARSFAHSNRNTAMVRDARLIETALEEWPAKPFLLDFFVELSKFQEFQGEIAAAPQLVAALGVALQACGNVERCSRAACIVSELAARPDSRAILAKNIRRANSSSPDSRKDDIVFLLEQAWAAQDTPATWQSEAGAALANLFQDANMRGMSDGSTLIEGFLLGAHEQPLALNLAALVNLTIDAGSSARAELAKRPQALDRLFACVVGNDPITKGQADLGQPLRSRAAALLSRIFADRSRFPHLVTEFLSRTPGATGQLALLLPSDAAPQAGQDLGLVEHLVRTIAALLQTDNRLSRPAVARVFGQLKEMGRQAACGSREVIKGGHQLAGNISQCAVSLAAEPETAGLQITRTDAIPALIKLLQYCEDGPTRKNAAIAIAKLARAGDENLQVIRSLRGMEMIVELGNRLIS